MTPLPPENLVNEDFSHNDTMVPKEVLGHRDKESILEKKIIAPAAELQLVDEKQSEPDREVLESKHSKLKDSKVNQKVLPFWLLFKYADWKDYILMLLGAIGAMINGLTFPVALAICSGILNKLGSTSSFAGTDPDEFEKEINEYVLRYVYMAMISGAGSFLEATCWMLTGERQSTRLRSMYLRAILRQNEGFFDTKGANTAEVVNSVSSETLVIQEAISEKVGHFIARASTFVGGLGVSFFLVWRVAIILLAFSPLLVLPG